MILYDHGLTVLGGILKGYHNRNAGFRDFATSNMKTFSLIQWLS
ncbi:hypothetical protein SAMN05192529_110127 [Arachidicoccus rhizosphaerae]|uniref:Uncharacterized protein n=1 Tax=Arachidicoccus rhizosphaerae TaxID=551991 RepID=A0A1H3ZAS4_9BACT|nr:hypothetical protein SAMN05192529_110127 [Arachidicoccus rhizosphaerae]